MPKGSIDNRIQLVRFDNWAKEQTHKNIGKKLSTTTHIHLYNHFDLIRGKTNGSYDIAFNFSEESTDFEKALKVFLEFISGDDDIFKELTDKILKAKLDAQSELGMPSDAEKS